MAARGVGIGDYVTIGLPNSVGFMEAAIAAWKVGAIPQPVSHRLPRGELEAVLDLVKPLLIVANKDLATQRATVSVADLLGEQLEFKLFDSKIAPTGKLRHRVVPPVGPN